MAGTRADSPSEALRFLEGLKPFPPPPGRFDDLRRLAKDLPAKAARDGGEEAIRALARGTFLIWQMALTARKPELLDICFDFWMRCGPRGWALAVRFLLLDSTDSRTVERTVGGLFARDQLLLLNQLVKIRRKSSSPAMKWARDSLADPSTRQNEDKLAFLLSLERHGSELAETLRETLIREGFSAWIGTRILRPPMEEDGLAAARAAGFFADRALDKTMARGLAAGNLAMKQALLRAAGTAGAGRHPALIQETLELLKNRDDPETGLMALEALIAMNPPGIEKAFDFMLADTTGHRDRVLRRTLLLNGRQYAAVSDRLGAEDREHADRLLMAVLLEADPEWVILFVADYIRNIPRKYSMDQRSLDDLATFFRNYRARHLDIPEAAGMEMERPQETENEPKPQEMGDRLKSLLRLKRPPKATPTPPGEFLGHMSGKRIVSPTLSDTPASNGVYRDSTILQGNFENVVFTDCVFDGAVFDNCWINGCRFENCAFQGTTFKETSFQWVFMKSCDLSKARFLSSSLTGLVIARSDFSGARISDSEMLLSSARETGFCETIFERSSVATSRFAAGDFSLAKVTTCSLRGVEFKECVFEAALIADCDLSASRTEGCIFKDCLSVHMRTQSPSLLSQTVEGRRRRIRETFSNGRRIDPPSWLFNPGCYEMVMQLVDGWFMRQDLTRRETLIRSLNRSRCDLGLESLPEEQAEFMALLPVLLQTDLLADKEGPKKEENVPHMDIQLDLAGFTPSFTAWELIQARFNSFGIDEPGPDAPGVSWVMALPPYGSMAQARLDPVNILLGLEAPLNREREKGLRVRLDRLRRWAASTFRLDIALYSINEELARSSPVIRPENLSGGRELSLTRDELFFKGTLLQGRPALWWLAPPDADETEAGDYLARARELPLDLPGRFADLGNPGALSREDAALHMLGQVEDVFRSPLDAVLELCLLLGETFPGDSGYPSCPRLKENLISGKQGLAALDSSGLTVLAALKALGNAGLSEVGNPIPVLFGVKVFARGAGRDLFRPGRAAANRFTRALFAKAGLPAETLQQAVRTGSSFKGRIQAGRLAAAFLTANIGRLKSSKSLAALDERTLERTEQAIVAAFSEQPDKIRRIPFLSPMSNAFDKLLFRAERTPGRPTIWTVSGLAGDRSGDDPEELARDSDLVRLLAWLAVNALYGPHMVVEADYTASPVLPEDFSRLLSLLTELFPPHDRGGTGPGAARAETMITKALFVVNLANPREADTIFEASTVYGSGVGSVFCFTRQIYDKFLQGRPREFLQTNVPDLTAGRAELFAFKPAKSRSPNLKI